MGKVKYDTLRGPDRHTLTQVHGMDMESINPPLDLVLQLTKTRVAMLKSRVREGERMVKYLESIVGKYSQ